MATYKPNNGDLSENPPSPEHLLRGFHGRDIKRSAKSIIPVDSLSDAHCLGRSDVIFYVSDKRDPKDPAGEGAQGHMKRFYHDQRPESYLFVVPVDGHIADEFLQRLTSLCTEAKLPSKLKKKGLWPKGALPSKIVDLGALEKVELSIGREKFELGFEGYRIFVWDNMRTLMALPVSSEGDILHADIYVWASNHTRVNWRGIID
jgi:hypothetical protein